MFKPGQLVKFIGVIMENGGRRRYTYGFNEFLDIGSIGTVIESPNNKGAFVYVNFDGIRPDLMMLPTELESGV